VSNERSSVTAFAPATIANVGSGFDVLGCALESLGDTVTARHSTTAGITIDAVTGDSGKLPVDPARNTAGVAVMAMWEALPNTVKLAQESCGIALTVNKGLPIGSGLGSSSASAAAALVAANELLKNPFERHELLPFAMEAERVACGAAHADNVAPSLLGGFVLIRSYSPLDIVQLPSPPSVLLAVVIPDVEVRTSDARKVLKKMVPLETAVIQWGNVAALVAGIYRDDPQLMGRSLTDSIIEPERCQLIPGFEQVKAAALASGALGCSISGSGPSVFALCPSKEQARSVTAAMQEAFRSFQISSTSHISAINATGARVIDHR
jgi:homoserine kinase